MAIRARRMEKGWSQEELAQHSGLSTRTIQRIENGQRASLESLKCLGAVFDTSVSTLMEEQTMDSEENLAERNTPATPMINEIERDAISFAQSILNGPRNGEKEPLTKIERRAVDFAKGLLARFNR